MKLIMLAMVVAFLTGCEADMIRFESAQGLTLDAEIEKKQLEDVVTDVQEETEPASLEESLAYVEVLLGLGETRGAEMELYSIMDALEEEGKNPEDYEQLAYYQQLIEEASEIEVVDEHNHEFTGYDAVSMAIEEYGADNDDIVYVFDETFEHYEEDKIGYYVAMKSLELEAQGEDGIVLMLFVGEDGSMTEVY